MFIRNSMFNINRDPDPNAGGGGAGAGDAEAAAAAAAVAAAAGGQGGGDWRATLAPEIKDHPSLKIFKTDADLKKSFWNSHKMIGTDPAAIVEPKDVSGYAQGYIANQRAIGAPKVVIPTKDTPPEDSKKFWAAMGVPETADKYVLPEIKLPEGMQKDANLEGNFKAWCHKHNVPPGQAAGLYQEYNAFVVGQVEAQGKANLKAMQDSETALRGEWGAAYEQKVNLTRQLVNQFGGAELKAELEKTGVFNGNNPAIVKFLGKIAEQFGEDVLLRGEGAGGPIMTPDKAQAEYNKILMDQTHPYNSQYHPEHKAAVELMESLFAQANPQLAEKK